MKTVKVGMMPGRLVEVAVEEVTTIGQAFDLAGVSVQEGYEIRMDGEVVGMDQIVSGNLVVASKKIKGNATIKCGIMPGRLVEVAIEGTESVKQVFELAGLEVQSGYEIKADGENTTLDASVNGVNLLLMTKQIKGNATVKIGTMPGRLVEVAVEDNTTIRQAFELADVTLLDGYEVKIDGESADLDNVVGNASLILQTKRIKGNK